MIVLFESADEGGVKSLGEVGDGFDVVGVENVEVVDLTLSLFPIPLLPIYNFTSLFDERRIKSDDPLISRKRHFIN